MLVGREGEQARIAAMLDAARDSRSGALVVLGEAGIGKTALLESASANDEFAAVADRAQRIVDSLEVTGS